MELAMRLICMGLLLLSACAGTARATPMSADDQAIFAKGTAESCMETQAREPANATLTVGQIQDFCGCYGKAFAEYMQLEEIEANKETLTPTVSAKATSLTQSCAAKVIKK
jgi:predicted outer membrane protein